MLTALRSFLTNPKPARAQATSVLRGVFAAMFLAQVGVAALLAGVLAWVVGVRAAPPLTSQILVVLALVGVPVAATMAHLRARSGSKGAALAGVLLAGVLLATPAWFLAFAALIGSGGVYLTLLLLVVVTAYALGFLLCGRFAGFALAAPKPASAQGAQAEGVDELAEQV